MGDEVVSANQAPVADEDLTEVGSNMPFYATSLWAMLIARIYDVFPLVCPQCGGELKIVAFLTEADPIQRILIYIDDPATPLASRLPVYHLTGWTRILIKQPRMNQKPLNPYRNLSLIRP